MMIGDVCNRNVICAARETTAAAAARLMREHHVGDVIVVDGYLDLILQGWAG